MQIINWTLCKCAIERENFSFTITIIRDCVIKCTHMIMIRVGMTLQLALCIQIYPCAGFQSESERILLAKWNFSWFYLRFSFSGFGFWIAKDRSQAVSKSTLRVILHISKLINVVELWRFALYLCSQLKVSQYLAIFMINISKFTFVTNFSTFGHCQWDALI